MGQCVRNIIRFALTSKIDREKKIDFKSASELGDITDVTNKLITLGLMNLNNSETINSRRNNTCDFIGWICLHIGRIMGCIVLVAFLSGVLTFALIFTGRFGMWIMYLPVGRCNFEDLRSIFECIGPGVWYCFFAASTILLVNLIAAPIHWCVAKKGGYFMSHVNISVYATPFYYSSVQLLGVIGIKIMRMSKSDVCDFGSYYNLMNATCYMYGSFMIIFLCIVYGFGLGIYSIGRCMQNRCNKYSEITNQQPQLLVA
jgi:hypothetical protein